MTAAWIDIAGYAWDAGFRGTSHATAVALTEPESGRNPAAVSPPNADGSIDRGLWQINSVHLQPGGLLDGWTPDELLDPARNAQAAKLVHDAQGFDAWTTYRAGAHEPWLPTAIVALDARARIARLQTSLDATHAQLDAANLQLATDESLVADLQGRLEGIRGLLPDLSRYATP